MYILNLFRINSESNSDSAYYYLNKKYPLDKIVNSKSSIAFITIEEKNSQII